MVEIFKLEPIVDDDRFARLNFIEEDLPSLLGREFLEEDFQPAQQQTLDWRISQLADVWKPFAVEGDVQSYNDYPCIGFDIPAFSDRAVHVLEDFLVPNGELLPLKSERHNYRAYNLLKKADVIDLEKSEIEYWCDPPTTAVDIDYFVFKKTKIRELSIFRVPQLPNYILVTDKFVRRVVDNGLNGFRFTKVFPLPEGESWTENKADHRRRLRKKNASVKRDSIENCNDPQALILELPLERKKPNRKEKKLIAGIESDLDAQLDVSLCGKYFGTFFPNEVNNGLVVIKIGCNDANELLEKLRPWYTSLTWPNFKITLRYGNVNDSSADEAVVE